jgi:hypothetical protein
MRTTAVLLATLACGCAGAPVGGEVEGWAGYGPIEGFAQIPRAGSAGSTSSNRPTFHELGIENAVLYSVEGRIQAANNAILAGYRWLQPSGSATLTQDLESQDDFFPAGTFTRTNDSIAFFRVDYERQLTLGPGLTLAPQAGFLFFDFHVRTEGSGGQSVSRGFSRGTFNLGLRLELRATPFIALEGIAFATPPVSNLPDVYSLQGRLKLKLLPFLEVFVGTGYDRYEFADTERPLNNHLRVRLGPLITGGAALEF